MRTCKRCGQTKPESEFYVDRSRPDGLSFYCRPCNKAKTAASLLRPPKHQSPPGLKRCSRCKAEKSVAEFSSSTKTHDGLDRRCKTCNYTLHEAWRQKNLKKAAADQKRWRDENPERFKDIQRKRYYGVASGWYAKTLEAQGGKCAICGSKDAGGKGTFHIDHCHATETVRELLCHHCNLALGHLRNDPDIAEKVKQYLLKHRKGGG